MNNNILNEEILRIKEVMGVKENLITEAPINLNQIARKIQQKFFDESALTKPKNSREWVYQSGSNKVNFSDFEYNYLLNNIKNTDFFENLPQGLAQKLGRLLSKDTELVDEYYKGIIESLGYNEYDLLRTVNKLVEDNYGYTTIDALEVLFKDRTVAAMLEDKIDNLIKNLDEITKRAINAPDYKTLAETFSQWEPGFIRFYRQYFDAAFKKYSEVEKEIEKTLDIIAKKKQDMMMGKTNYKYDKDIEKIINLLVAQKVKFYESADGAFKKYLIDNKMFKDDETFNKLKEEPRIKELLTQLNTSGGESFKIALTANLKAYLQMLYKPFAFRNKEMLADGWRKVGNTILWKNPLGWREIRNIAQQTGVAGKIIDKIIGAAIVNYGVIPAMTAAAQQYRPNAEEEAYFNQLEDLFKKFCGEEPLISSEDCAELERLRNEEEVETKDRFKERFIENLPYGFDKSIGENLWGLTYVDEVFSGLEKYVAAPLIWSDLDAYKNLIGNERIDKADAILTKYGFDPNEDMKVNIPVMLEKIKNNPGGEEEVDNAIPGETSNAPEEQSVQDGTLTREEAKRIGFDLDNYLRGLQEDDPNGKVYKGDNDNTVIVLWNNAKYKGVKIGNEWYYNGDTKNPLLKINQEETAPRESYINKKRMINQVNTKTLKESIRNKVLLKHEEKKYKIKKINENLRKFEENFYYGDYNKFFDKMFKLAESYKKSKLYLNEDDNVTFDSALIQSGLFKGQEDRMKQEFCNYVCNKLGLEGEVRRNFEDRVSNYPFNDIGQLFTDTDKMIDMIYKSFSDSISNDSSTPDNFISVLQSTIKPYLKTADFERNFKSNLTSVSEPIMDNARKKVDNLVMKIKELLAKEESKG